MNFILFIIATIALYSIAFYTGILVSKREIIKEDNVRTHYFVIHFNEQNIMKSCRFFLTKDEMIEFSENLQEGSSLSFEYIDTHISIKAPNTDESVQGSST